MPTFDVVLVTPTQHVEAIVVSGPRGLPGPPGSGGGAANITGEYPVFYDAGSGVVGIVSGYYATVPELTGVSGALVAQISASAAGVSTLNGQSGMLTLQGAGSVSVITNGQTIIISGSAPTGSSSYSSTFSFTSAVPTGSDRYYVNFPIAFATTPVVGVTLETSAASVSYATAVSGRATTGFWALFSDDVIENGLSLNVFAQEVSPLSFVVALPTGSDTYFVSFPSTLSSVPVVNVSLEVAQTDVYGVSVSGRSTAGFYALFTETILQTGASLNVLAR